MYQIFVRLHFACTSSQKNLASTFVNAFVNAGFGNDKLMMVENNEWIYKNKDHGMMSATASLGMIQVSFAALIPAGSLKLVQSCGNGKVLTTRISTHTRTIPTSKPER